MSAGPTHARFLLQHINDATPGGIRREQFLRRHHPLKALLSALPFIALAAAAVVVVITR
jgi:hypothetical protein